MELPSPFKERMKQMLGEEYGPFLKSFDADRARGLRLNLLKTDRDAFFKWAPFTLRPVPWAGEGYYYGPEDRPGRHPYHEAGVYYIQEPSAMAVVSLLDPKPGECILDLCAAPGGKTTQIASRMGGAGLLVSNEIHPARARILSRNVERMGIANAVVANEEAGRLSEAFPEFFDRIVVDAPCSGEGMFRKDEEARAEWSPENVKLCALRQRELLAHAASMLKPGGRLVYSTCTFAPEENEGTISHFLSGHPEFSVEGTPKWEGFSSGVPEWGEGGPEELKETVRIWPHRAGGEGHFIAVLKKSGEGTERKRNYPAYMKNKNSKDRKLLEDFISFCREALLEETQWTERKELVLYGEQLYLLPPQMIRFDGLRVIRPGLWLGSFKKNRFEPSHAWAMALGEKEAAAFCRLPASSSLAASYLRGEALPLKEICGEREREAHWGGGGGYGTAALGQIEKAWILMTIDGYSIGWARLAGGILKNHYPKGLRK